MSRAFPASLSALDVFLRLRSDLQVSDRDFARAVFALPLFEEKRVLVGRVLANRWNSDRMEDALQNAALRVFLHLVATRGERFVGSTEDSLGRWFYLLWRRNSRWAMRNLRRASCRRAARERQVARREPHHSIPPGSFARLLQQIFVQIDRLPPNLRTVAFDLLFDVSADQTAETCGLSKRRVYELRVEVLALAKNWIAEVV